MNVTPAALDAIYYAFDARFQAAFERTPVWYDKVASVMPSATRSQRHYWMALIPRLREWLGERVLHNVQARSTEIVNKSWELTIELDREQIEDDQLGVFNPTLDMMGAQARKWPDDVMVALLQSGTTTASYDGQNFFDTSHPVKLGSSSLGTYQNNFTSTALTPTNYQAVRQAMQSYIGEDGKPLAINPSLLLVPPQLEIQAKQIIGASMIAPAGAFGVNAAAGMQTNVLVGTANVIVIPELSNDPTSWYLMDATKPVLPLIWQLRKAPEMVSLTGPETSNSFYRRKYVYGIYSRGNAGFGLPFLMARATA